MKIPLSWLKQYVDINLAPSQVAKIFTMAGLEVDAIEKMSHGFKNVVVGRVLECQKHPKADHLTIASVSDGEETYQVVCGASNCRAGIKTAFARVGAVLVDEEGREFKIKKAKLREVESFGMLCSFDELGLPGNSEGIIEFSEHLKEGQEVSSLYEDAIFDISLTPNLGHCASVLGAARELSASMGAPLHFPDVTVSENPEEPIGKNIEVDVLEPELCPRYACRMIKGVTVAPSPDWLKIKIESCSIRSVNNIVDATNYILIGIGHPLHAFDADRIAGNKVIIRKGRSGETIVTLDGKTRELESHDLLICDEEKPLAIGGVMGGAEAEVTDQTRNILIEAAYFAPAAIRRTSKRLGLMTESSKRFERGVDPNGVIEALDQACVLIKEIAGGEICEGVLDVASQVFNNKVILCRLSRVNKILGTLLSLSEVESIWQRLDFTFLWDGSDLFHVTVPTYRNDLKEEIDLVEEVARIYGYNNIQSKNCRFTNSDLPHVYMYEFERKIRSKMVAEGLQEFITCDLIGPSIASFFQESSMGENGTIQILNPTSIEQSQLRTSLLPGLLQVVKRNIDYQNHNINGFEIGRIHYKEGESYKERDVTAVVLSGNRTPYHWENKAQEFDFYDLKGILENIFGELGVQTVSFKGSSLASFHPKRQALIYSGIYEIGVLGEVHPTICRKFGVSQRVFFAEINIYDLFQYTKKEVKMTDIALYPGSERDWTLTVDENMELAAILEAIHLVDSKLLEKVSLLDIYRSEKLGMGIKNLTLRFAYRDDKKTISQEEVDSEHSKILSKVSHSIKLVNT